MNIYLEIENEIMSQKYDMKNRKVYKFILILSLLDYFEDLKLPQNAYNNSINVELLLPYYRLYLEHESLKSITYANESNVYHDSKILRLMQENPLRHLCHNSKYFLNNDQGYLHQNPAGKPSRKTCYLPDKFMIEINRKFDYMKMTETIRKACFRKIHQITDVQLDESVVVIMNDKKDTEKKESYGRVGQHQYRQKLIDKYQCKCALCEIDLINILVASHAKPWRHCDSVHEKLSDNNGLLLCANHDQLFDKGFITIDPNNNEILISSHMSQHQRKMLETSIHKKVILKPEEYKYFMHHKDIIFKK